ncbi:MAG: DNA topoisomerase IB [Chloroflexi bacterium]|nr:MAG: DNA topoisomerase IB [Chloroflexota bacterium]
MHLGRPASDAVEAARSAALRYVTDAVPGICRKHAGNSFAYSGPDGERIRDREMLGRIRSLAIPPAWRDVWICPLPNGHLQATGRDARGRKQYRCHPRWRQVRDENKYEHLIAFGRALPRIRRRVRRDLARPGVPREKALAAVVRLLETTLIRIGNQEYARENNSFGLTTMRDRHVRVNGSKVVFQFAGKSQKKHVVHLTDAQLARVIKTCRDIPGYPLFQYIDDTGERRNLESGDVNEYLREVSGQDCTAKDFRTWAGTVLAAYALQEFEAFDSDAQAKKNVVRAIESVAERLGNTATVCRNCYVHPEVISAYLDGSLVEILQARAESELASSLRGLRAEEAAVLALLQQRLAREARKS